MVLISAAGWSSPKIAGHLGRHPAHRPGGQGFAARGTAAIYLDAPGPDPAHDRQAAVTGKLSELLGQDRTWTAPQLADARPADTSRLKIYYLEECGFSPSRPTRYSWSLPRQRKRVRYEYPQGRRANALATYEPAARHLDAAPFERTLASDNLLTHLQDRLPTAGVPRVEALDNVGIHTCKAVKAARPGLSKRGIYPYYLPRYSPELNRIEPVFEQVKHHEMPTRSFTTRADLRKSVEDGFDAYRRRLRTKCDNESRLAAYSSSHASPVAGPPPRAWGSRDLPQRK